MMLRILKKIIPEKLFKKAQPFYHHALARAGAIVYGFPSKQIKVLGITGTKGKSSTVEFASSILEAAGYKTALMGTIRFKVGDLSRPNLYKMSMPGRFFMQKFLREAVDAHCDWAVIELTSEGMVQYRHAYIELDAAIFLNITPEHIESHGSFENYLSAKIKMKTVLEESPKKDKVMIVNADDKHAQDFLSTHLETVIPFTLKDAGYWDATEHGIAFTFGGERISSPLHGAFMIKNALAASFFAQHIGISAEVIKKGIEKVREIKGRVQMITLPESHKKKGKQNFEVVVDYAHTVESLEALYGAFPNRNKICVLGNTGGGRDSWKRPVMAKVAERYCDDIILTNEDPYDEDPMSIVMTMKDVIKKTSVEIILDRRNAIREALIRAKVSKKQTIVLISGKGTDPYIMEANGKKTTWSDAQVAQEELAKVLG